MNKLTLSIFFICGLFFIATPSHAQFRRIPGIVTDSFKVKYPSASSVTWEDKITSFQATFMLDSSKYNAKFSSKGEWQSSERKIKHAQIPAVVKDGLSKSKYADWKMGTVTQRYLPGDKVEFTIFVAKGDLTRKNLTFSSEGQLLKDNTTL